LTAKGKGRVIPHKRGGVYIYVPAEVAGDTLFPFKEKCDALVYIQGKRLIVEKFFEVSGINEERDANYKAYLRVKEDFMKKHAGKFAVITNGKVVCIADSAKEAIQVAVKKEPKAKHRILWKVGEDEEIKVRKLGGSWLRRLR
jgi:N-methylhydantoinase A/oxoprolinase/acetone carboxylase beta subunit